MIRDVILPQLAMGMSEGTIVEWAVKEGARVARDQSLVSIETEKVVVELPAPYAGFAHLIARSGETSAIETVIAKITDSEDEYRSLIAGSGATGILIPELPKESVTAYDGLPASDQVHSGLSTNPQLPVAASPQFIAQVGASTVGASRKIRASGLAKAIARKNEIDLAQITGSGPGGRVIRRDVVATIEQKKQTGDLPVKATAISGGLREKARVPVTGMRATIAQRMLAAKTTAAQTYLFFEIDITKLLAARAVILANQAELDGRMSLTPFYIRALALACQQVPICNATLADNLVTLWENVNVGIAVAIPGRGEYDSGLVVPVIRDTQAKALMQINREMKDLVSRARSSTLSPDEMTNGTITLSSTDGFLPGSWMVSTPLLNLPQVVNFQPGSPIEKPVVIDGNVVVRTMLPCGLTFDHRALDGEPAGRFVKALRDLLSNPELMLL
ncbi:Dihydrolipoamide acetyltransferase component of pyruvate dehydrogenase complex [Georgfuchsia toluolica]|uniref:Dihydrolipoamide acetyltransferase component of pyruvate dehydrogenase complex n=1 Tax=Georgfuchsia toluolica TaxID=424218 RepID=A0A916J189_9PROT|nr:dihydrolipoamide acetyltransferase family protein [Georgfuchsia toluolica]CAG4882723.1 Dihydrolipoamide acetyltransferase component of pyruvate dehydrogenase complex [Georgfuchsia toluolica]